MIQSDTHSETADPAGKSLYSIGGAAALAMLVIIIVQFITVVLVPPPYDGTAVEWFDLFQQNKLAGLINFELLMVVYMIISIPVSLALFFALRRVNPYLMTLFVALNLVGIAAWISARPAVEMLNLSNSYATAASESQRAMYLAAGETLIASFHGTAFHVSYILGSLTGLIVSYVILKSHVFSKLTAYVRIASSVFDFSLYVPGIGMYISILSVLFLFIFNILAARQLFQLGRRKPDDLSVSPVYAGDQYA